MTRVPSGVPLFSVYHVEAMVKYIQNWTRWIQGIGLFMGLILHTGIFHICSPKTSNKTRDEVSSQKPMLLLN
uniref:Uncharacterized protein n=1 Tax=Anguilla anguilla TaxID=7936 RepID=A0A0E9X3D2_ANGAN